MIPGQKNIYTLLNFQYPNNIPQGPGLEIYWAENKKENKETQEKSKDQTLLHKVPETSKKKKNSKH